MVTIRKVIIFLLKASIADLITLLSSSVQNSEDGGEGNTAAIVVLTPAKNLNKFFGGFLVVSPLFNHFLGYV
jgi:hypothetical protein